MRFDRSTMITQAKSGLCDTGFWNQCLFLKLSDTSLFELNLEALKCFDSQTQGASRLEFESYLCTFCSYFGKFFNLSVSQFYDLYSDNEKTTL